MMMMMMMKMYLFQNNFPNWKYYGNGGLHIKIYLISLSVYKSHPSSSGHTIIGPHYSSRAVVVQLLFHQTFVTCEALFYGINDGTNNNDRINTTMVCIQFPKSFF